MTSRVGTTSASAWQPVDLDGDSLDRHGCLSLGHHRAHEGTRHRRRRLHRLPHRARAAGARPPCRHLRPRARGPDGPDRCRARGPRRRGRTPRCSRTSSTRSTIEGVIHFAGRKFVAESMRDPGRYFRVNVAGSLSVLEAMVAAGTPLIVFSSSCTVYGTPDTNPVTEDAAAAPGEPLRHQQGDGRADAALVRAASTASAR